jgi:hypothetical protein
LTVFSSSFVVGALQLLVARENLLVRGLQFLVRSLELLNDRLQVLPAGCQLTLQEVVLLDVAATLGTGRRGFGFLGRDRRRARTIVEQDEIMRAPGRCQRDHFDADGTPALAGTHLKPALVHGGLGFARGMQRSP